MEDESTLVQTEAAESIMELLDAIENPIVLLPTDFKAFQLYIFPAYKKKEKSSSLYMKATLIKLMGHICRNGRRFIEQGIINQTNYFKSLRQKELSKEESKLVGVDYSLGYNRSISNLDTEIDNMRNMVIPMTVCLIYEVPQIFQCGIISHLCELINFIGNKNAGSVISLLFAMLNSKSFQLVINIFRYGPNISLMVGRDLVQNLLTCFDVYMFASEELVLYYVIKCFIQFIKIELLEKEEKIELYTKFSALLVHPNKWLKCAAIEYCKTAGESLNPSEFFVRLRIMLHGFVRNFIMVTSSDPFQEFLIPPLTRVSIDLLEGNIKERINYTANDEFAKVMLENKYNIVDLKAAYQPEEKKYEYDEYVAEIKSVYKKSPIDCIGRNTVNNLTLSMQTEHGSRLLGNIHNSITSINDQFEINEVEIDDYIDSHYVMHSVPDPNLFFLDNNGLNPSKCYQNFLNLEVKENIKWRTYFKNSSICKALNFYTKNSDSNQARVRPTVHQWRIWKPQGRLMSTLNSHEAPVYSIDASDNCSLMATGSSDGVCNVWDTTKLSEILAISPLKTISVNEKISCIKFLQGGHNISIGTNKGVISIFKIGMDMEKDTDIITTNEGGIVNCCTCFDNDGQNTLFYATQQGRIHVHDIRAKRDVNVFDMTTQKGLISNFCMGRYENNFFIGTVGGYIANYDTRFNLITDMRKHIHEAPITDMCVYLSERTSKSTPFKELPPPLLFIATSGISSQIDLCSINKDTPEWTFAIGNPSMFYQTYIPYGLSTEELNYTDINQMILKRLTKNFSIIGDLNKNQASDNLNELQGIFKKFCDETSKMYNQYSIIYKILCPRISQNEESAPFLLTAGSDSIVRYWYLGNITMPNELKMNAPNMIKNSFVFTSPDNREVEYAIENFNNKVMFERVIRDKEKSNGIGQSSWQTMNGNSYINKKINKTVYSGHSDAILNMELLELPTSKYLVTCGRDHMVKLWV